MDKPQKRFAAHLDAQTFYKGWIVQVHQALFKYDIKPADLAQLLGNPDSTRLRRRLRGESRFDGYEMVRISDGLGISLSPN